MERELRAVWKSERKAAWEYPTWFQAESCLRVLPLTHHLASLGLSFLMCHRDLNA